MGSCARLSWACGGALLSRLGGSLVALAVLTVIGTAVSGAGLANEAASPAAQRLDGHGGPIKGIAVTTDGRFILTASFDNSIGLWSAAERGAVRWREGHEAAVNAVVEITSVRSSSLFAGPEAHRTFASVSDDGSLRIWRGGRVSVLRGHKTKIMDVSVGRSDQALLATASWDGTIGLWPAALVFGGIEGPSGTPDDKAQRTLSSGGRTLAAETSPTFLEGHRAGVNAVAFNTDGSRLFSASVDGTIRSWRLRDGAAGADPIRIEVAHGFGINTLTIAPDDSWLAYGATDGVVRVLDPASGQKIAQFGGERRPVLAMALSPDGQRLAYGDGHGFITVVAVDGWQIERDFRAVRRGPVWAMAFVDDRTLVSGGLDDFASFWPIEADRLPALATSTSTRFHVDPETVSNGERQFRRKCAVCHALTPDGRRRAGPTLHGLFGRRIATVDGYNYSSALANMDLVWSAETIDRLFDIGPDHYTPGSKMPMQRIVDPADRADLIAFLRAATGPDAVSGTQ